ncbi:transporter [Desulfovibrio sp. JY]|nr:transporter [Desulfovibrio sp. JY]
MNHVSRRPSSPLPCYLCLALALSLVLFAPGRAAAVEGGLSHYIPGAYGDFLMGYIPEAGFYLRNDTLHQSYHMDGTLKGGRAYAGLKVHSVLNLTKMSYMFDVPAINGLLGIGVGVPVIINEHITGDLAANYTTRAAATGLDTPHHLAYGAGGDRGGLSDIFLMPVIAAWNPGECHIAVMPIVFLPTGYYNKHKLTNLGMNFATFDGNVAFTWLHKGKYEISLNAGYMINTENPSTHYLSGNQLHVDWTAAYHFTPRFGLGAVGYLLAQTTPDSGTGAKMGSFESSGSGIGPAATYTVPIGGKDLMLMAKWIHDLGASHSFLGDTIYGSFAIKF